MAPRKVNPVNELSEKTAQRNKFYRFFKKKKRKLQFYRKF